MASRQTFKRGTVLAPRTSTLILTETDKLLYGDARKELDAGDDELREPGNDKLSLRDLSRRDCNLIFAMPLFWMIAIYQPFIYFVIQLKEVYELGMNAIGLLIAAFHLCRLIAIIGTVFAPKSSHLVGTLIGLIAYSCLLFFSDTSNVAIFASCNIAVGFIEASAVMFVYSKKAYAKDMEKMRMAMSYQSAVIGVAVILGFFFGGFVFQGFGIAGVAFIGVICSGLELVSLLYFLIAPPGDKISDASGDVEVSDEGEGSPPGNKGPKFRRTLIAYSIDKGTPQDEIMGEYSGAEEIAASKFTYFVAAIFSFDSIVCGYLYSIGPLFIFDTFGVNEGTIGIIFSLASLFGSVLTFAAISSKGREFQKKYTRSPYNLYISIVVSTLSVIGLLIPNFPAQVVCIIFIHGAMELFLTLIAELQGAITTLHYFTVIGPTAQMSRKILNIVMSFTGPIMYGVFSRLPYLISGSLCVIYAFAFILFTQRQQKDNEKKIAELLALDKNLDTEEAESLAKKYSRMTMASKECMARMAECTLKVMDIDNEEIMDALEEVEED